MRLSSITLASLLAPTGLGILCTKESWDEIDETTGASPEIDDCKVMMDNISGGGDWQVQPELLHHQIVQYGTCAFGLASNDIKFRKIKIGNGDIINMVTNSIRNYGKDGKVGASGTIRCSVMGGTDSVDMRWNILHN